MNFGRKEHYLYARLWRTQLSGPTANSKRVDTVRNEWNEIISCLTQFDLMAFISLMLRAARLFYHLLLLLLLYIIAGSIDRFWGEEGNRRYRELLPFIFIVIVV